MCAQQLPLFDTDSIQQENYSFPSTRYQGSKRKLTHWIWQNVKDLQFDSVLDVFGGTGVVSHLFKNKGKAVTYNDYLAFNHNIGLALIENSSETLSLEHINELFQFDNQYHCPDFIESNFQDIYYPKDENRFLDRIIYRIDQQFTSPYKKAIARFALFQACIIKRPYNLFHRANLYMRTAEVKRSFGNKKTWDTPFEVHMRQFISEANQAIFDNGQQNQSIQFDALQTPKGFDLVYIDPPYINGKGTGVDYRDFYHFLEGMMDYNNWQNNIDHKSKHRRLKRENTPWTNANDITSAFESLIQHHRESILVVSYRDDGIPSKEVLIQLLKMHKDMVIEAKYPIQYALSNKKSKELLLIAT